MTSEIRTNSLKSRAGLSTVTFTDSGPMFSGITTFVENSSFNIGTGSSIFSPATNTLTLGTNSAERLRISSDGNMGLGTNSLVGNAANVYLTINGSNLGGIALRANGLTQGYLQGTSSLIRLSSDGSKPITFDTNGSERFRIHSDGKVGINQDNPHALLSLGAGVNPIKLLLYDNEDNNKYGFGIQANELRQFYPDDSRLVIGTISRSDGSTFNEKLRIKSNGTVNIGTNNQASGDSSSKLRVGTASGSDAGVVVFGNGDTTTPALIITNWDGAQTQNKSIIHFDNSGWGSHQIGSLAGSDGFGIFDDSVLRMSINNVGNTTFHSTGHIVLPSGTTAQRVNTTGAIRYNNSLGNLEFYDGSAWKRVKLLEGPPTNGLIAYWPFSSASRSGTTYNDQSGNNHHLTANGTITDDTTESKFSGCIDFGTADGNHYLKSSSNSFVDLDASSGYSGVSISVWVKTTVTNNYQQWIISEGTVNTRWNYFVENATGPKWRSTNSGDITMSGSMMTGNWHHLVVTFNSSNNLVQHYRDGVFTNQGTTNTPGFTGDYLLVGQHSVLSGTSSSYRWRGKMAHMRIYNRVLTSSEVTTLYQQW